MKFYELTYLISLDVSDDELRESQRRLQTLIENDGGVLSSAGLPVKRSLAYPIQKRNSARLATILFYMPQDKIPDLMTKLKTEKSILRFLLFSRREKFIARKAKRERSQISAPGAKAKEVRESKVELERIEEKIEELLKD